MRPEKTCMCVFSLTHGSNPIVLNMAAHLDKAQHEYMCFWVLTDRPNPKVLMVSFSLYPAQLKIWIGKNHLNVFNISFSVLVLVMWVLE